MRTLTVKSPSPQLIEYAAFRADENEKDRRFKISLLGLDVGITIEESPACMRAWITELESLSGEDRARYRVKTLVPIIDRLIPVAANDQETSPRVKARIEAKLQEIRTKLLDLDRRD